jgi:photosystem II stability/assembly factor-like uncharacterized protein
MSALYSFFSRYASLVGTVLAVLALCLSSFIQAYSQNSSWQKLSGPGNNGGLVTSLASGPNGYLFAGIPWPAGGAYRSTNDGNTWDKVLSSFVEVLGVDKFGNVYAGIVTGGVYRSTDGGVKWDSLNTRGWVNAFLSGPGDTFFKAGFGIDRSTDGGATWIAADSGLPDSSVLSLAASSTGVLYAGTNGHGVYVSTNQGASWTSTAFMTGAISCLGVDNAGVILAGAGGTGIIRSSDQGGSWAEENAGLTSLYPQAFAFGPDETAYVVTGWGGGVFRSTDRGKSWVLANYGVATTYLHALVFSSTGKLFAGTDHVGLFRTSNRGDSWELVGLPTYPRINRIATSGSSNVFAATYLYGLYRSTDSGQNWISCETPVRFDEAYALATNRYGHIFVGTDQAGALRSTDNGATWARINNGLTNSSIRSFVFDMMGNAFAASSESGVFRSTDNGESWTAINEGLTNAWANCIISCVDTSLLVGTNSSPGIFRSTDNGNTWNVSNTGMTLSHGEVTRLVVSKSGAVIAVTFDGLYRSWNNGKSWQRVSTSSYLGYRGLVVYGNSELFAIDGYNLVLKSTDMSETWEQVGGGVGGELMSIAVDDDGYIYAGTDQAGLYRSSGPATSVVAKDLRNVPGAFALFQNYPNPFNPTTVIRCELPLDGRVTIDVFDILGRQVAVLLDGRKEAGTYDVTWNAGSFPSGVYFCRMTAGGFVLSRKLLLSR